MSRSSTKGVSAAIQLINVASIRPEAGLSRKRERTGHEELCRSIQRFGVLTPISVRPSEDGSGEYLLVKGQGRTLACRQLGIKKIPAVVVNSISETEKVQHFLLENVARLRMRPIDRALLIAHARSKGEETAAVASRFGVTAATVRKLESLLKDMSRDETAALLDGRVSLAVRSVLVRHVPPEERGRYSNLLGLSKLGSGDLDRLFLALGWSAQVELGPEYRENRFRLFQWAIRTLMQLRHMTWPERLTELAVRLPRELTGSKEIAV